MMTPDTNPKKNFHMRRKNRPYTTRNFSPFQFLNPLRIAATKYIQSQEKGQ